jgi:excisionase family DNA binding protein
MAKRSAGRRPPKAAAVKIRRKKQKPALTKPALTKPALAKPAAGTRRGEYLTPTEVADQLLVAPVTVRLWANKGLLPSVTTLGGHRRFRAEDVQAFVEQHQQSRPGYRMPASRVLIIDDDPQFSRYLAGVIAKQAVGTAVDVAHDGFSAGVKCQALRPDIVTLDLHMPDMDGFEVCAMLRTMFGKARPRIVALTGFASAANVERIIAAGADCCVAKTTPTQTLLMEMGLIPAVGL